MSDVCVSYRSNNTVILCTTKSAPKLLGSGRRRRAIRKSYVSVTIDGATLYSPEHFEYKTDSKVTKIIHSQSIHSGGTNITVLGSNLHIVQNPRVGILVKEVQKEVESVSFKGFILTITPN